MEQNSKGYNRKKEPFQEDKSLCLEINLKIYLRINPILLGLQLIR